MKGIGKTTVAHWSSAEAIYRAPDSRRGTCIPPSEQHRNSYTEAMFTGEQIAGLFVEIGATHVLTVPDSTIGQWEQAIEQRSELRLVRVCREGEAWGIAAGLYLGGARPIVMIQCTGLFESGDALRNVVHDWHLPIYSVIGYRSYLNQDTLPGDTCLTFTEPILDAWKLDYRLVTSSGQLSMIGEHAAQCFAGNRAGAALIAEGKA